jgi:hypothetical protein
VSVLEGLTYDIDPFFAMGGSQKSDELLLEVVGEA